VNIAGLSIFFMTNVNGKDFNRPAWKTLMRKLNCLTITNILGLAKLKMEQNHGILISRSDNPMTKLKYNLKSDTLFKMLFSRNQDLLKRLVAALLGKGIFHRH